jgi:hypothetical protein
MMSINKSVVKFHWEKWLDDVKDTNLPKKTAPAGIKVCGVRSIGPIFSSGTWLENRRVAETWCSDNNSEYWNFTVAQSHHLNQATVLGVFFGQLE